MLCPANLLGVNVIRLPRTNGRGPVIPSGVSRAFGFARSAGTRSRGISIRCNARLCANLRAAVEGRGPPPRMPGIAREM